MESGWVARRFEITGKTCCRELVIVTQLKRVKGE
jgi:hypothetical protein